MKKKYSFELEYIQVMDENGVIDKEIMPKPILTEKEIKDIFELMLFTRILDNKCVKLQRTGRLGTYAISYGEEAAIVTPAYLLGRNSWIAPSYREQGAYLAKNYPLDRLLLYFSGCEAGLSETKKYRILPMCIPVGTQTLHAAGLAWGLSKAKNKSMVLCYFGDGATSTGDFHEAMNFAGVFNAPVIFLCRNNRYAISLPFKKQTGSETVAQKAVAYGIKSMRVDGNDIFSVACAVKEAMRHAKKGRPYLIECVTYRLGDHTTSDDEKKYRKRAEVRKHLEKEPVKRLREYMKSRKIWTKKYEEKLMREFDSRIDRAVKKAESYEEESTAVFSSVFKKPVVEKHAEKS